ncbi:hypothetical protein ACWX0P_27880 [Vibrio mediterranei]|uniref:hypothetical protein n=1 Tax=Vibrio mediterranei TaxID=689 RepID=UPI001EFDD364|nr:hypothetical protein [Vibrio mediterranei]MCG9660870.1 hypothetical protein [Vibrio mediterranei]
MTALQIASSVFVLVATAGTITGSIKREIQRSVQVVIDNQKKLYDENQELKRKIDFMMTGE